MTNHNHQRKRKKKKRKREREHLYTTQTYAESPSFREARVDSPENEASFPLTKDTGTRIHPRTLIPHPPAHIAGCRRCSKAASEAIVLRKKDDLKQKTGINEHHWSTTVAITQRWKEMAENQTNSCTDIFVKKRMKDNGLEGVLRGKALPRYFFITVFIYFSFLFTFGPRMFLDALRLGECGRATMKHRHVRSCELPNKTWKKTKDTKMSSSCFLYYSESPTREVISRCFNPDEQ